MIACKLASAAPSRVLSLALISTSNGGFDCLPRVSSEPRQAIPPLPLQSLRQTQYTAADTLQCPKHGSAWHGMAWLARCLRCSPRQLEEAGHSVMLWNQGRQREEREGARKGLGGSMNAPQADREVGSSSWLRFVQMEVRTFRLVARMFQAKAPEDRAAVDLDTHFSEVSGTGDPEVKV